MRLLERLLLDKNHASTRLILPEGDDVRVRAAAEELATLNAFKKIRLLGSSSYAAKSPIVEYVSTKDAALIDSTCNRLVEVVQSKGRVADKEALSILAHDPLYQAGALAAESSDTSALGGACHATSHLIKAALMTVGTRPGIKLVSGCFILERPVGDPVHNKPDLLCFADCGVVIEPSIDDLVSIAAASCHTWQAVTGTAPVVGFLSFSTKGSAKHAHVDKMIEATSQFKAKYPHIACDGELQFDAAIDESIGQRKSPLSPAAGRVNVCVFPDLNAGNLAYKIAQRLGGYGAYGPLLQGLNRPYNDLSRGSTVQDIVSSAIIGARL
jgi:phosphate acetyltransferase